MSAAIKLGVIGCGKHAYQSHIRPVLEMGDLIDITLLNDLNQTAAEKIAAECNNFGHKMKVVTSATELIGSTNVDAILIATPPVAHMELLEAALRGGKHVLCEKPIWNGTKETTKARELFAFAKEKDLVVTTCHPRRYEPPYPEIRSELKGYVEKFGTLREINFRFFYHVPPKGWRQNDSLLLDHMNHEVDLVNYLIGRGPVRLCKIFDSANQYRVTGERLEANGPSISFSGYRKLDTKTYRNELELIFDRGRVLVVSVLVNSNVRSAITIENFDLVGGSKIKVANHNVDVPFKGIMRNLAEAIQKTSPNYLETEDLIYNNESANHLMENADYTNQVA